MDSEVGGTSRAVEPELGIEARADIVRRLVLLASALTQDHRVIPVEPAAVRGRVTVPRVVEGVGAGAGSHGGRRAPDRARLDSPADRQHGEKRHRATSANESLDRVDLMG
jgi:hypothetical protein